MESPRLKVMICDDEPRLCAAWERLVGSQKDMEFMGALDRADTLLDAMRRLKPEVLLMDLTMPGMDPLDVLRQATAENLETRIIVYSGYNDPDTLQQVVDAGAWGLVDKLQAPTEILNAIRRVAAGDAVLPLGPSNP